jgi:hypothetical protein
LEVRLEPAPNSSRCAIEVRTAGQARTAGPGRTAGQESLLLPRTKAIAVEATATSRFTKPRPCRRARTPGRRVPLLADELPEQESSHRSPVGDEPEASRRRRTSVNLGHRRSAAGVDPDASSWAGAEVRRRGSCRSPSRGSMRPLGSEPALACVAKRARGSRNPSTQSGRAPRWRRRREDAAELHQERPRRRRRPRDRNDCGAAASGSGWRASKAAQRLPGGRRRWGGWPPSTECC